MAVMTASSSTATVREQFRLGSVTSKDGTTIGYRQIGHGPGIVLVHGAMESALSHSQLAEALADTFTVCVYDRRGRGRSGPYGQDYGVHKEVEDLDAVLGQTGARSVFGVSSGGVIALQAALSLPAIHRLAVFEPALVIDGEPSMAFLTRYDQEIAQGRLAAALVTGMQGTQMGPAIFNLMPRWLLEQLTQRMMAAEDKHAGGDDVTMGRLAPTLHYDFQLIAESQGALERFRAIRAELLLLGGSASPAYLRRAVDALGRILPRARRIVFPGLGHGASGNTDRGGRPERVARELCQFFS